MKKAIILVLMLLGINSFLAQSMVDTNFGEVEIGSFLTKTFAVTNTGNEITEVNLVLNSTAFTVSGEKNYTLGVGEYYDHEITFSPSSAITYKAFLTISTSIPGFENNTIILSGEGFINQPPQVINATIEGELILGKTVKVTYDFLDEEREGETIFQWYRSTDRVNWEKVINDRLSQSRLNLGGFIRSGDYLRVSIIPLDRSSIQGQEVIVETSTPIIYLTPPITCNSTVENGNDLVLTWKAPEIPQGQKLLEYQISNKGEVIATISATSSLTYKIIGVPDGFHSYTIRCNYYPGGFSKDAYFGGRTFSNGLLKEQPKNYPNPFSPTTTIEISTDKSAIIEVKMYNIKGKMVRVLAHKEFTPGRHRLDWDGKDDQGNALASGVYFYHVISSEEEYSQKMLLMK